MRAILDTHVLLWSFADPSRIGPQAAEAFRERITKTWISAASLWEISTKRAAGRLAAPDDFLSRVLSAGHEVLPISGEHAWLAGNLPPHHKDPFDRILVAQAILEDVALVTHDQQLLAYDARIIRA